MTQRQPLEPPKPLTLEDIWREEDERSKQWDAIIEAIRTGKSTPQTDAVLGVVREAMGGT